MNILVVEDDPMLRKALILFLTGEGHYVLGASDGQHALNVVQDNRNIELVICDMMMHAIPGPAFIMMLKHLPEMSMPRIIVISGMEEADTFPEKAMVRYDYFLSKPVDFFTLKTLIGHISNEQAV